ncbi:MAG TPA: glutathione S-transferase C-terminal domain-containing protein, partial [Fontimonas sp.]
FENLRLMRRLDQAKRQRSVRRWPAPDPLDEYPLVPFLLTADGAVHYDSSGIAGWLDETRAADMPALIPEDPALALVCALIDEALDEVGLYLVHHHRWVVSHDDNTAGSRLAHEFRSLLLPPLRPLLARRFAARQIRRLPYLFSVAPEPSQGPTAGRPPPPARAGFPATHARLESAWDELVDAAALALRDRPYLLGERFTLADAALYGQLNMNMSDPSSERRLRARAPALRRWLQRIEDGEHAVSRGALALHDGLGPLLRWICSSFIPLMRANAQAWALQRAGGRTRWNEAAFNRGEALFDLQWRGAPARSVVKTFQVRVWRDLRARAQALPETAFAALPCADALRAALLEPVDHP